MRLNGCMNKVNLATEWVNYGDKQNLTLLHITSWHNNKFTEV